jgi:phage terminase large subunit
MPGAYYARQIAGLEAAGRIGKFPPLEGVPVNTAWDLGMDDETAIWFWQDTPDGPRVIDYLHGRKKGVEDYAVMLWDRGYRYRRHVAPHDINVGEWGTGKTRIESAAEVGIAFEIAPFLGVADGINAVRHVLPRCVFDERRCEGGLDSLRSYRNEYDEEKRTFALKPVHDFASHGADAFRYMAVSMDTGDVMARGGAGAGVGEEEPDGF